MMGDGFDMGSMWWFWLFGFLLVAGVVVLVVLVALAARGGIATGPPPPAPGGPPGRSRARQILDERFARGELTTEEYQDRVRALEERP